MTTAVKMDVMPESQIQAIGIEALKSKLGVTGTLKFLEQFDNGGSGGNGTDYEKYNNWYRLSENGANVNTIAAPTLENWIFRGYYDDPTNGSIVIDSEGNLPSATYFKSDTTLYAHWVRGEYICVAGKAADNSTPCDSGYYCPGTKVPDGTENSEEAGCRRKCPTDVKGGDIRSASSNTTISGCYTVRNNVTLSDQTGSGDETCYYNQAINLYEDLSCNIAIKKCIAGRYRELESSTTCAVVGTGAYSPANDTAKHLCSELDGADETTTTETTTSASAEDCYNQCPNISIANGTRVAKHAIVHYNGTSIPACEYTTECNTGYQPSGETCIPKIIPVTLNHNGGTSSLNKIYLKEPALYERDYEPEGFKWIAINDMQNNVYGIRRNGKTSSVAAFFNFSNTGHIYVYTPEQDETLTMLLHSDWECFNGTIPRPSRKKKIKARGIGGCRIELPPFSAILFEIKQGI